MNPEQEKLFNFVPATGEISYQEFYDAVLASPDRKNIKEFHAMRRAGLLSVRLDSSTIPPVMYVSRPQGA